MSERKVFWAGDTLAKHLPLFDRLIASGWLVSGGDLLPESDELTLTFLLPRIAPDTTREAISKQVAVRLNGGFVPGFEEMVGYRGAELGISYDGPCDGQFIATLERMAAVASPD